MTFFTHSTPVVLTAFLFLTPSNSLLHSHQSPITLILVLCLDKLVIVRTHGSPKSRQSIYFVFDWLTGWWIGWLSRSHSKTCEENVKLGTMSGLDCWNVSNIRSFFFTKRENVGFYTTRFKTKFRKNGKIYLNFNSNTSNTSFLISALKWLAQLKGQRFLPKHS